MSVRIRNIYLLLCYAWDHLEAQDLVETATDLGDRIENLMAQVLSQGVARLLSQGLDRGYVERTESIAGVKGKLLIADSVRTLQFERGRATCLVDELTVDVPHNRIIKAAMRALAHIETVDKGLRQRLRHQLVRFSEVSDVELTPAGFRAVQLHRNLARYSFLLKLCALISRQLTPDAVAGITQFHPFDTDEQEMGAVFEKFVYRFLKREQSQFVVSRSQWDWEAEADRVEDLHFLPVMKTDVVLTSRHRRIVIETKYYAAPLRYRKNNKQAKLISSHLFQITSYLARLGAEPGPVPEGILLYAGVGEPFDLSFTIKNNRVRALSLELDRPWSSIRYDLRQLVNDTRAAGT